jgi:hypothetical protein
MYITNRTTGETNKPIVRTDKQYRVTNHQEPLRANLLLMKAIALLLIKDVLDTA